MASAGKTIASIWAKLGLDTSGLRDSRQKVRGSLKRTEKAFKSAGSTMTQAITLPLAAAGGAAVKMASDFEREFAKIEGLVGVAGDEVERLRSETLSLAGETAQSPRKLAKAMFFVTSAGLRGQKAVNALRASAKAASAGLGNVETVADAVTSAMNAYGQENLSASEATDVLVSTVREGKVEASELSGSLGKVIPLAAQMGVEFDQVGGVLASLTRVGANSARSVTSLAAILRTMLNPTKEAREQLRGVGLSVEGLRNRLRSGDILGVLQLLQRRFKGNQEAMSKVFGNARALKGVLGLVGKNGKQVEQIMASMSDSAGATDEAFGAMNDTLGFQANRALAQLQALGVSVGRTLANMLVPVVRVTANVLTTLRRAYDNLGPAGQRFANVLGIVAAALGPVALAIGGLLSIIPTLKRGLMALRTAFLALNTTTLAYVGAAAAVAAVAWLLYDNWESVMQGISRLWDGLVNMVKGGARLIRAYFERAFVGLKQIVFDALASAISQIQAFLESVGAGDTALADSLGDAQAKLRNMVPPDAAAQANRNIQEAKNQVSKGVGQMQRTVSSATTSIQGMWNDMMDTLGFGSGSDSVFGSTVTTQTGSERVAGFPQQTVPGGAGSGGSGSGSPSDSSSGSSGPQMSGFEGAGVDEGLGMSQIQAVQLRMEGVTTRMQEMWRTVKREALRAVNTMAMGIGRVIGRILTFQKKVDGIGGAFKAIGSVVVRALQRMISKLIQAAIQAAILSAILSATGVGSIGGISGGGFGNVFGQVMGFAEGGIVTSPTMGMIGEGNEAEAVMPLSKLDAMLQRSQGKRPVQVRVQGESRIEKGDVVTSYDSGRRNNNRYGGSTSRVQ